MFRAHVLIIRRSKLHYTASGIITPISEIHGQQTVVKISHKNYSPESIVICMSNGIECATMQGRKYLLFGNSS